MTQVIKIGTSSLVNFAKKSFNIGVLAQLCEAVRNLKDQGQRHSFTAVADHGLGSMAV
jgi:glutamate 5-kinase